MSFKIINYKPNMLEEIIEIWNSDVATNDYLSKYSKSRFQEEVINNRHFNKEGFKVLVDINNNIIGYGLAIYNIDLNEDSGYIPFIVIKRNFQRKGYGTKLLKILIRYLKDNEKKYIRQMFLSPINLKWNIKGSKGHIHPNTPAVLYNSDYYLFLINNNFYINGDNQNAYYLNIENFKLNNRLIERENNHLKNGYKIELYNKDIHYGEKDLFEELNNNVWYESFKSNIESNNYPMLVITKSNEILGWAGPIYTKEDKRGYFSGIGVSPKIRGKGFGTLLFNKLIDEFKNNQAEYMSLFTGENNKARFIYEKSGFKIVNSFSVLRKKII